MYFARKRQELQDLEQCVLESFFKALSAIHPEVGVQRLFDYPGNCFQGVNAAQGKRTYGLVARFQPPR